MELHDLDDAEQLAFGGLLRMMIRKDGDFSEAEEARVDALSGSAGREAIWRLISRSAQDLRDDSSIRLAASRISRAETRTYILEALSQVAAADGTNEAEAQMLVWLRSIW